ncbi:MAG: hypothetical protein N3A38_15670 [Planctomycetota bacterium]|nr:hypothetical protein [Planctomycetota bacterium]
MLPVMWVFPPLVLIAALVVVVRLLRREAIPSRSRAPRPRHIAARIVCGILGIGVLVALGVGTLMEARDGLYSVLESADHIKVRVPAQQPPEPPEGLDSGEAAPLNRARVLMHAVFIKGEYPIHAEEIDIRLPEDAGRIFSKEGRLGSAHYEFTLAPRGVRAWKSEDGSVRLDGEVQVSSEFRSALYSSSRVVRVLSFGRPYVLSEFKPADPHPLSVTRSPLTGTVVVLYARLVRRDDPLKEVPLGQYTREVGGFESLGWRKSEERFAGGAAHPDAPPILAFAESAGFSFLFLLAAAVLLAQMFARRGLAFAGTLALCLLYAAALDRMALCIHMDRLADGNRPATVRALAAESLPCTFFYRKTAWNAAKGTAENQSAPEPLRKVARRLEERLRPRAAVEFSAPEFSLSWDLKHAENAGFRVEEMHSGDDGRFILHVPAGEKRLGITPAIEVHLLSGRGGDGYWNASLPLYWDNGRLDVESGTREPSVSYSIFSEAMYWSYDLKQAAPNVFGIVFHLELVPIGRPTRAVKRDFSITVEVRQD